MLGGGMDYFTYDIDGSCVCVWYECGHGHDATWIVHFAMGDKVLSMDGVTALHSDCVQADIARSVGRALQWAGAVRGISRHGTDPLGATS